MRKNKLISLKGAKTFAFVVDGDTEVWYLQMLKRNERDLSVNIEPKLPRKKSISEQYIMVESLVDDYTKVFWIVDYDVINKETKESKKGSETTEQLFIRLRNKLKKYKNVIVIVNNPCIEYWFLLHFEQTSKLFVECISAENQLKKHLNTYEKSRKYFTKQDDDIYLKLKKNLTTAIQNAKKISRFNQTNTNKAICEMDLFYGIKEIDKIINLK